MTLHDNLLIIQFLKDFREFTEDEENEKDIDRLITKLSKEVGKKVIEKPKDITIEIRDGVLVDVRGLAKGQSYKLIDWDNIEG